MNTDIKEYLSSQRVKIDALLVDVLKELSGVTPTSLFQPMSYSLLLPGKRLRPMLAMASCHCLGGQEADMGLLACALEMVHTYSLIQDDLPCMDDDDYRRGQLTCHKVFGEAQALLASDALLTEGLRLLTKLPVPLDIRYQLMDEILGSLGVSGMIGGQSIDVKGLDAPTEEDMKSLHARKTGALLCSSVRAGAMFAKATPSQLEALTKYGHSFGLAFQVMDDILDVTSSLDVLGKIPSGDRRKGKKTFVDLLGIENAKMYAENLIQQAILSLQPLGASAKTLWELALFVLRK